MEKIFSNLPKEVIYYSLIPVVVIILIDFLLLIFMKKRKDNGFRFSMLIKISLIISIAIVLPLIIGYTIWVIERFINKNIMMENIGFVALIVCLCIILLVLLFIIFRRTLKYLKEIKKD